MLTAIKNFFTTNIIPTSVSVGKTSYSFVKRIVTPTILSIGRVFSSAGGQLFALLKFFEYMTGSQNHPYRLPSSFIAAIFNIIVNIATRVPALFYLFSPNPNNDKHQLVIQDSDHPSEENKTCVGELGLSTPIYVLLRAYGTANGIFIALNLYLGAMTIGEFIAELAGDNIDDEPWKEQLLQAVGLFFAVCNVMSFISVNLPKVKARSYEHAKAFHEGKIPTDDAAKKTLLISIFGTIAAPFFSYFSTTGALAKIPYVNQQSENLLRFIAVNSGISLLASNMLTQVPAVYAALQPNHTHLRFDQRAWEKPVTAVVHGAGFFDAAVSGIGSFTGMVKTINKEFSIDEKDPTLIAFSTVSATSSAALYFFFIHEVNKDMMEIYHRRRGEVGYFPVSQNQQVILPPPPTPQLEEIFVVKHSQPINIPQPRSHYQNDYHFFANRDGARLNNIFGFIAGVPEKEDDLIKRDINI
ncbi:MAG: hypothetical protein ACD_46C00089G0006 [uncultured bacterium]|nr:MAG: hypothetical protein ACD_46C00089G0006 [uncultured bacterium]